MTKRKNLIILIIAVICGLIGVLAVMNYVGSVETVYSDKPTGQVVVCARDIPENARITNDMIRVADVENEYILPQAFTKSEDVVGTMAKTFIFKGEQILKGRVSKGDRPDEFSYGIPEGRRAVSIAVDPVSGVSGLIRPRDRVDVLATITIPEDSSAGSQESSTSGGGNRQDTENTGVSWLTELKFFQKVARKLLEGRRIASVDGKNITFALFQNVEVLAVGSKVASEQPKGGLLDAKDTPEVVEAKTITLCLEPEQVDVLVNAEKVGLIKLDLRNPAMKKPLHLNPYWNTGRSESGRNMNAA